MAQNSLKVCETCGAEYAPAKHWQKYCTAACKPKKYILSVCKLDGCEKPSLGADSYCSMHATRILRHGSPDVTLRHRNLPGAKPVPSEQSISKPGRAYARFPAPEHPLADAAGTVAVHRWVLYERIGPGSHACHWCGIEVRWMKGLRPGALVADHVDANPRNNEPGNVVQACQRCNAARGRFRV